MNRCCYFAARQLVSFGVVSHDSFSSDGPILFERAKAPLGTRKEGREPRRECLVFLASENLSFGRL